MNNSRPIFKIFLFPYTECTEHIFSSNFANFFFFLPAHENARYANTPETVSMNAGLRGRGRGRHSDFSMVSMTPFENLFNSFGTEELFTKVQEPIETMLFDFIISHLLKQRYLYFNYRYMYLYLRIKTDVSI